jgi:hypothetical protein
MTKQKRMYDSIISVTSSVSKLTAEILAVLIDMNKMSDKFQQKFNDTYFRSSSITTKKGFPHHKQTPLETYIIGKRIPSTFRRRSDTIEVTDVTRLAITGPHCANKG